MSIKNLGNVFTQMVNGFLVVSDQKKDVVLINDVVLAVIEHEKNDVMILLENDKPSKNLEKTIEELALWYINDKTTITTKYKKQHIYWIDDTTYDDVILIGKGGNCTVDDIYNSIEKIHGYDTSDIISDVMEKLEEIDEDKTIVINDVLDVDVYDSDFILTLDNDVYNKVWDNQKIDFMTNDGFYLNKDIMQVVLKDGDGNVDGKISFYGNVIESLYDYSNISNVDDNLNDLLNDGSILRAYLESNEKEFSVNNYDKEYIFTYYDRIDRYTLDLTNNDDDIILPDNYLAVFNNHAYGSRISIYEITKKDLTE
jgi:hypothetical protein